MKRALLVLLFLNVAFFGYTRLVGEPGAAPATTEPAAPVPRLALLSEFKTPAGGSCLSVGPFADRAVAAQAGAWLRSARRAPRERSVEIEGPANYWVALVTKTMQEATAISMRLKAAGVNDIVVTPPGAGQTEAAVSLGVYADRAHAERRVSDLRRLAVNPAIVEQPHKVTQWWLDVVVQKGETPLDAGVLAKAVPAAGGVGVTQCPAGGAPAPAEGPPAAPAAPKMAPDQPSPGPPPAKLPSAPA